MVARRRQGESGFTYVGLVVFVAILGMVGAATLKVDALLRRAQAEQELLEIGAAYSEALRSYAAATPPGFPRLPPTLQDLLKDPRFPGTRRHLRKIFVDPITGSLEWGVLYQGDKVGVLALYSLSQARPLKLANFDPRFHNFENKAHLSDWKFSAAGERAAVAPAEPVAVGITPLLPPRTPMPEMPALPPASPADAPAAPPDEPQEEPQEEPAEQPEPPEPPPTTADTASGR